MKKRGNQPDERFNRMVDFAQSTSRVPGRYQGPMATPKGPSLADRCVDFLRRVFARIGGRDSRQSDDDVMGQYGSMVDYQRRERS